MGGVILLKTNQQVAAESSRWVGVVAGSWWVGLAAGSWWVGLAVGSQWAELAEDTLRG